MFKRINISLITELFRIHQKDINDAYRKIERKKNCC